MSGALPLAALLRPGECEDGLRVCFNAVKNLQKSLLKQPAAGLR